jgi:hypothetical protein
MKLRKFNKAHRLNEDDQNTQQQQTAAPAPAANAQPAAPQAQPAAPAQPSAPAQPAAQNVAPQQQPAQQQPAQQNQQQPQANAADVEKIQKANQFLEGVKNNIKENKIYWAIATDFVKEIQDNIPDFKADNQAAKPGIDAWEAFKKEPGEATFNTFMDALSAFAAPQQPEQQTSEQAQQAQALQDSVVLDFGARLEERLRKRVIYDELTGQIEQGIYEAQHNI